MESFLVQIEFVLILMARMLWQTTCTRDCSFYTFNENTKDWRTSQSECQANGGDLLSMETVKEYQFINKTIQGLNKGKNEWYIGLKRTTGVWKWVNEHSLTITKWQPSEPSLDGDCVIIAKQWPPGKYGLFNDLKCHVYRMFICEYTKVSNHTQGVLKYCPSGTTTARPLIATTRTTRTKTTIPNELTSLSVSHTDATSYTETNTSIPVSPNPKALKTSTPGNAPQRFPTMLVAIVLGILLAVGICTFFVVFWWLKRKSGRSKSKRKPWQSNASTTPTAENRAYLTNRRNNTPGQPATEDIQLTEPDSELYAEIPDYLQPRDSPTTSNSYEVEYANSPGFTTPSSRYATLIQTPVYGNQMPYQPLNKYPEEMDEDEIAI